MGGSGEEPWRGVEAGESSTDFISKEQNAQWRYYFVCTLLAMFNDPVHRERCR